MKIDRSDQILTIKETPGCLWIFGLFFAVIGSMFVYGALGGYSNFDQITPLMIAAHLFGGLCGIAAGYWIIYKAPVTRITIDRTNETVTYRRHGIAGRHNTTFSFGQIRRFSILEEADSDGDPAFSLTMELANDEVLKISAIHSPVEAEKRDLAFRANEFLYKQIPSYRAENPLEDET